MRHEDGVESLYLKVCEPAWPYKSTRVVSSSLALSLCQWLSTKRVIEFSAVLLDTMTCRSRIFVCQLVAQAQYEHENDVEYHHYDDLTSM